MAEELKRKLEASEKRLEAANIKANRLEAERDGLSDELGRQCRQTDEANGVLSKRDAAHQVLYGGVTSPQSLLWPSSFIYVRQESTRGCLHTYPF